jgi:hypothetical protein
MLKLIRALRQELFQTRTLVPLVIGLAWCTRPLLHPETGWQPWPDLLYESMTTYLIVDLGLRVRRVLRGSDTV